MGECAVLGDVENLDRVAGFGVIDDEEAALAVGADIETDAVRLEIGGLVRRDGRQRPLVARRLQVDHVEAAAQCLVAAHHGAPIERTDIGEAPLTVDGDVLGAGDGSDLGAVGRHLGPDAGEIARRRQEAPAEYADDADDDHKPDDDVAQQTRHVRSPLFS